MKKRTVRDARFRSSTPTPAAPAAPSRAQRSTTELRTEAATTHRRSLESRVAIRDAKSALAAYDIEAMMPLLETADTDERRSMRDSIRCMLGMQRWNRGDIAGAEAAWTRAMTDAPTLAEPHAMWGHMIMKSDPAGAIVHLSRAIERDPKDATIQANRGRCHARLGDHQRAVSDFNRALAIEPDDADDLYDLGKSLVELNRHMEALKCYDRAIALAPDYVDFYESRALVRAVLHDYTRAVADCDRVFALDASNIPAKLVRGRCFRMLKRNDEALHDYDDVLQGGYDKFEVHMERGVLLREKGEFALALVAFNRALEMRPGNEDALVCRSEMFKRLGKDARAQDDMNVVVTNMINEGRLVDTLDEIERTKRAEIEKTGRRPRN